MMRTRPLLPLFIALAALRCSPAEPKPPAPPKLLASATPAAATPAAAVTSAPATTALPSSPRAAIKVFAVLDGMSVVSYPATGFERLTPSQRALAYHLTQAAIAGDPLFTMQTSRYGLPVTELVRRLLAQRDKLDPAFRDKLLAYRRKVFIAHGIHTFGGARKFAPTFTAKELEAAAKAVGVEVSKDLLAGIFDPRVASMMVSKTPGKGQDPLTASAANHYEGVTSADLKGFKDRYELNGRVVKQQGKIVEQVYRAGGEGEPPGLGEKQLGRVVQHLTDALPLAPKEEAEALSLLIRYFRTGDNAEFRRHDIAWLKQSFTVDYILGFIETFTDVRERKGAFEGLVTIADPDRDPPLQALAKSALYFEQKLPWEAKWKRDTFKLPASSAVNVVAATGFATITPVGINLPNPQDLREQYGTRNFVLLSLMDANEALYGERSIDEFAPDEARAEIHRCARALRFASVSFHEVTGHGSGKVNPGLAADPSALLAPYFAAMEEGRAELVADYLMGDPKTVEIGLLPDAGCARVFPQLETSGYLTAHTAVRAGDAVEEDHLRGAMIAYGVLRDKGAITVEKRRDKTFFVVKDPNAWRRAAGELLAELQRIKSTGDREAMKALVDRYGSHLDPKLRDEVVARRGTLGLADEWLAIPPLLTPVLDASGKVVDARAEQPASLDAYIEAIERASLD